jgi:hypothetical protein
MGGTREHKEENLSKWLITNYHHNLSSFFFFFFFFLQYYQQPGFMFVADDENSQKSLLHELTSHTGVAITQGGELVSAEELSFMDLSTIVAATDNFSDSNKLAKGGFGVVYKVTPTFLFLCGIKIASYGPKFMLGFGYFS